MVKISATDEEGDMTELSQKPLRMTGHMPDDMGDLLAKGHGIENFERVLDMHLNAKQRPGST